MKISISKFRKTTEELRELDKENNIKLLKLLKYLIRKTIKGLKRGQL